MNNFLNSLDIIKKYQDSSGAYVASPNFSQYGFCWFRDSSFIARAMYRAGESICARKFFDWAVKVIRNNRPDIEKVLLKDKSELTHKDLLPTRYRVDGSANNDDWPNGQSDGYGTFLWAAHECGYEVPADVSKMVVNYIEKIWEVPCYDAWEEGPEYLHTSTLFSLAAGLKAQSIATGQKNCYELILQKVLTQHTKNGRFVKSTGNDCVDSSLLWCSYPYALYSNGNELVINTVSEIERTLKKGCGLKRYLNDTYFGAGSWTLLSANLGSYYARNGEKEKALEIKRWLDTNFDSNGFLAEQIAENLLAPDMYEPWVKRWGSIASPLLWAHAEYINLCLDIQNS